MGLTVRGGAAANGRPTPRRLGRSLLGAVASATPQPLRRFANHHLLPRDVREYFVLLKTLTDIDFSRTQAFALPTDLQGFIRLNLQGREPEGTVSPERYDAVCDAIVEELESLRHADTGERVVEKVFRTRALYGDADNVDLLPDLCVLWTNARPVPAATSPRFGRLDVPETFRERSGNHRLEGFWFAVGPDIRSRRQHQRAQIYDLAATVFQLLHKPVPDDWDGRPLPVV
jgi:predicted AlkP superfamily phosphohydrolase/phosphomutase